MAQLVTGSSSTQAHPFNSHSDDDLDLLHQTLDSASSRNSHSLAEDHLEDILSLPLAQELHSRRSHAKLSHASSVSSLASHAHEPLPRAPPPPASSSPARRPQKSRSSSPELSNRPIPPPGPTKIPLSRTRSKSKGATDRLGAGSGSGRERSGAGTTAAAEGWETLQVGSSSSSSPSPTPSTIRARPITAAPAGSAGMQRSRTAGSLPSSHSSHSTQPLSFPPSATSNVPPLPLTPPTSSAGVRKRAKTSNLLSSPSSAPGSGKRALSPSSSSPSTPRTSPTPTPRSKPPTTASPPVPSVTRKARRKSFSAATSYRIGEMDREESLPAAPWLQEGPRVFRDQGGGDGFKTEGRVEDMVLPAVARRLEAERLARLESEGLITHWDRDGAPMVASVVGRNGGSGRGTPKPMDVEESGKDEQKDEEKGSGTPGFHQQPNSVNCDTYPPRHPSTPSSASANDDADTRSSLPPPRPPQKDAQFQRPTSSDRERDSSGLLRAQSSTEKGRSKEERRPLEQERDKEQKGCCAGCLIM